MNISRGDFKVGIIVACIFALIVIALNGGGETILGITLIIISFIREIIKVIRPYVLGFIAAIGFINLLSESVANRVVKKLEERNQLDE